MAYDFETELEDEFEGELEGEAEEEMEDEGEGEGWLGTLGNIAGSLLGESEGEEEYEDEGELEGEYEFEGEDEGEFEMEEELSPIRKIYPDAMMEHLGELAAEAESEEEAVEHFLPLIGMAASKILPVVAKAGKITKGLSKVAHVAKLANASKVARAVSKTTPHLTKSIGHVVRTLHRNPATRHLLKTVPGIARRTVGSIARQAVHGRRITPRTAVHTLARQAKRVLGHPGHRKHALRRHNHLERKFHGRMGRGFARPHVRYGLHRGRGWRAGGAASPGSIARGSVARGSVAGRSIVRRGATGVSRGVAGVPGVGRTVHYGGVAGRPGTCPPCPSCGTAAVAHQATAVAPTSAPVPAYCRCCGQVIR
jgi:hypothetical protein